MRALRESEVHLWRASLERHPTEVDSLASLLAPDEKERAERFRFAELRARFIVGRGLLRKLLAEYVSCKPNEIDFGYSEFGKPEMVSPVNRPIHFNVAHSEDRLLIGIAAEAVGVDVEKLRGFPEIDALTKQVFSGPELERWRDAREEARLSDFIRLWTRKEALLKGIGLGITQHVRDVSVFFQNRETVVVPASLSAREWRVITYAEPMEIWSVAVPFGSPEVSGLSL